MVEPAFEAAAASARRRAAWCAAAARYVSRLVQQPAHAAAESCRRGDAVAILPMLLISGFGAHRVLQRECGLHVLELADGHSGAEPGDGPRPARRHAAGRRAARQACERSSQGVRPRRRSSTVVRRYRGEPSPLVRDADGGWRSGRLDAVLRGDFDLIAAAQG